MDIVICGGGTAGWLSAFIFARANPFQHNITVVESSKIGIIGAGEASSGLIIDILSGYHFKNNKAISLDKKEIDIIDFIEKTDGVPKYALKHINWAKDKSYYFAPVVGTVTPKSTPDHIFNYVISEYGVEKAHLASDTGQAYEANKYPIKGDFGLHFDAFKVGEYVKNYLIKYYNVKCIDSTIKNVNLKSNGFVESISLENDVLVSGDLFVDCTGFQKILANKLNIKWHSYKEYLPVDRAMPFLINYEKNTKIKPYTEAEALSSGWMWRTALTSRKGCGYVYSSDFISEEDAQKEAEKIMGHPIQPIKHIKFDSGRVEQVLKNNCLISGLASSFIEPLEATSIHATLVQVYTFCKEYLTSNIETTLSPHNVKSYNDIMIKTLESFLDFTVLHYQGGREDSDFWKYIKNEKLITPSVENYIERAKVRIPTALHFTEELWGANDLWKWSLAGLNLVSADMAKEELIQFDTYDYSKAMYKLFKEDSDKTLKDVKDAFEIDLNIPISNYLKNFYNLLNN